MFDNVDRNKVIEMLPRILRRTETQWRSEAAERGSPLARLSITTLVHLVDVILNNSYCEFKGKKYHLTYGVAMGGPLSVTISTIYVYIYERYLLHKYASQFNLLLYKRYVDDTILAFPTKEDGDRFTQFINDQFRDMHKTRIKFECENESEQGELNFLDIKISRRSAGGAGWRWRTRVYRKPTNVNRYLHPRSFIPTQYLRSTVRSLVHRAQRYCNWPDDLQQELAFIRRNLALHGYPDQLLRLVSNVKCSRSKRSEVVTDKKFEYTSLPYYGEKSMALKRYLARYGIKTAFRCPNLLRQQLYKAKSQSAKEAHHCVYKVDCTGCSGFYIGKTTRALKTRMAEHQRDISKASHTTKGDDTESTALTQHALETGHQFAFARSQPVFSARTDYQLKMFESLSIKALRQHGCVNGNDTSVPVSDAWAGTFEPIRKSIERKTRSPTVT